MFLVFGVLESCPMLMHEAGGPVSYIFAYWKIESAIKTAKLRAGGLLD